MKKYSLNGNWHLEGGGYSCDGMVPGSVYSFLLDNQLMPDPYYRDNELEALKILENDFAFSRTFDFDLPVSGARVLLCCEGLDTLCDLYVNGSHIAYTDNMHRRYELDVTEVLKQGKNEITARFYSPNRYIEALHEKEPLRAPADALAGFNYIRKASCMMGWDWGPRLPDAGIWKDISLLIVDSDRLTDVHILQRHEDGKVFVTPLVKAEKGTAEISVAVTAPNGERFTIPANTESEIRDPMLWWPNGFGKANLYMVSVELYENGSVVDSDTKRIGLREMKLVREKDEYGESFCHEVNGVRIFAMGADYIPEDNILTRITKERSEALLRHCIECNFNTIRIWGGGFYPHDFFFDLCDELGLLVFYDMMFACMEVPRDREMHENIAAEVRDNLIRTRHHACIALLSGNNEVEEMLERDDRDARVSNACKANYIEVFEHLIPDVIKEVCPYLPYVPSSPSSFGSFIEPTNENYGDCHYWQVWHSSKPAFEYRNHYFRYLSEFGYQSFPCEKTVNAFTEESDRNIYSRIMDLHQRSRGATKKIIGPMADVYLYPTDFGTLLYASQLMQADAIRNCVEHLRRHRGRCMGALYWQLNDIWPGPSWASIDSFGRYKALQYIAKRFFAPIMISCDEIGETTTRLYACMDPYRYDYSTQAQLCVTNETVQDVSGVVKWELRSADSQILQSGSETITVPALTSVWLDNIDFEKTDVLNNYLSYAFEVDGVAVSEGTVLFTAPKHYHFKDPNLRYEIHGKEITVFADAYAKSVEIDSPDSDFILSDNYFDMNAGSKTVTVLEGDINTVTLRSVYDIR